jgi:hypothetical protein
MLNAATFDESLIYSVAFSPQANYTDWATATCRRNLVPTFVDRRVSRGQRGGPPTVVNLTRASFTEFNDKNFTRPYASCWKW